MDKLTNIPEFWYLPIVIFDGCCVRTGDIHFPGASGLTAEYLYSGFVTVPMAIHIILPSIFVFDTE